MAWFLPVSTRTCSSHHRRCWRLMSLAQTPSGGFRTCNRQETYERISSFVYIDVLSFDTIHHFTNTKLLWCLQLYSFYDLSIEPTKNLIPLVSHPLSIWSTDVYYTLQTTSTEVANTHANFTPRVFMRTLLLNYRCVRVNFE